MSRDFWVGAGIAGFAILLLAVLIPSAVATPKAVRAIVLSPVFWPNILAVLLLLGGAALAFTGWRQSASVQETPAQPGRMAAVFVLMPVYVAAIPWLGMVWASMAAFAVFLVIIRPRERLAGVLTAVLLPLGLYVFFYHIAGVAIPQGRFVILP